MNALMITAVLLTTVLMTVGLRALDRRIRRRQQLAYLRGPLREQLQYMMNSPAVRAIPSPVTTVPVTRPAGLLTDHRLSA